MAGISKVRLKCDVLMRLLMPPSLGLATAFLGSSIEEMTFWHMRSSRLASVGAAMGLTSLRLSGSRMEVVDSSWYICTRSMVRERTSFTSDSNTPAEIVSEKWTKTWRPKANGVRHLPPIDRTVKCGPHPGNPACPF